MVTDGKDIVVVVFSFKSCLLRNNSHIMKFTIFRVQF